MSFYFQCGVLAQLLFLFTGCNSGNSADAKTKDVRCVTDCKRVDAISLASSETAVFSADRSNRTKRKFDSQNFSHDIEQLPTNASDETVSVHWSPQVNQPSLPVILFIEPGQKPISALGRFRTQVLGRYQYDSSAGSFQPDTQDYQVPAAFEKLNALYRQYQPALDWVSVDTNSHFDSKKVEPFDRFSTNYHGTFVFDLLASRVPSARFVFAEFPKMDDLLTCDEADSRAEALTKIEARFNQLKAAYQKVLAYHDVTDIVLTHTFLPSAFARILPEKCSPLKYSTKKVIDLFVKYNETVFANDNIRVYQALWNDSNQLRSKEDWSVNCPKYRNIFRISYISSSRTDIPSEGLPLKDETAPSDQVDNWNRGCSQVIINSGFDEVTNYGDEDSGVYYQSVPKFPSNRRYLGAPRLGAFAENLEHKYIMANSWATPLAAAMALHIDANFRSLYGRRATVDEMKRLLIGRIFDPILNDQFEIYYER